MQRTRLDLSGIPLFGRCFAACALLAVAGGAVFGFVRGLHYLPTVPFAVVEGAFLFGVPGAVVGILVGGVATLVARVVHPAR